MTVASTPLIRLESISKSFGAIQANQNISLDIHAGRILSLLGENGAGKSTLMSVLSGRMRPDSGRILIDGEAQHVYSTQTAIHGRATAGGNLKTAPPPKPCSDI